MCVHSTPRKRDAALAALKRIRALTPDAMWRAPQKKLEDSVPLAGPYVEQRIKALRTGVDHLPPVAGSAEDDSRSAGAGAPCAERAAADGRGGGLPDAAVRRRSTGDAGRRAHQSRGETPGLRRAPQGIHANRAVGSRRALHSSRARACRVSTDVPLPQPPRRNDVHRGGPALPVCPLLEDVSRGRTEGEP